MGALSTLLSDPSALFYLAQVKRWDSAAKRLPKDKALAFCYDVLNRVSRSFAIVIQQLGPELRDAVCVFYLVLRGLDTVEDDMSIPDAIKLPALLAFHERIYDRTFTAECGPATKGHYKELMAKFPLVVEAFLGLKVEYQEAIAEVTRLMGQGMAEFITKDVHTLKDYNRYCYYVAGLVGVGLSRLFAAGGLEAQEFALDADLDEKGLSNSMGLFLQKTNIIRDYLEARTLSATRLHVAGIDVAFQDIMEEPAPRMFWPKVVWSKYGKSLADFKDPANIDNAVRCLNHLVTNAMAHAPDSLEYMARLRDQQVFRFCAIPQVMAIATLAECYDNPKVFSSVVKIPRSTSARIMVTTRTMTDVVRMFGHYSRALERKIRDEDPNSKAMHKALLTLKHALEAQAEAHPPSPGFPYHLFLLCLLCLLAWLARASILSMLA